MNMVTAIYRLRKLLAIVIPAAEFFQVQPPLWNRLTGHWPSMKIAFTHRILSSCYRCPNTPAAASSSITIPSCPLLVYPPTSRLPISTRSPTR